MRLLVTGLVFLPAVGLFFRFGLVEESVPYLALHDMAKKAPVGECCVDGTIHSIESMSPLRFTVSAGTDASFLVSVESNEPAPPNFRVGNKVGVRGTYHPQAGKFVAVDVRTQSPSCLYSRLKI